MTFNNMQRPDDQNNDRRNLIIFMLAVFVLFMVYDVFIKQPYVDKARALQEAQKQEQTSQEAPIAKAPAEPVIIERSKAVSQGNRLSFESPTISGSIALKGARFDDLTLHNYFETIEDKVEVSLLSPSGTERPYFSSFGWLATGSSANNIAVPDKNTLWRVSGNNKLTPTSPVTLYWISPQNIRFELTISLDKQYMFAIDQKVINNSGKAISVAPYALVAEHGSLASQKRKAVILHEGPISYIDDELYEKKYKDLFKKGRFEEQGSRGWIGFTQKYWFVGLIPQQNEETKYRVIGQKIDDTPIYQADTIGTETIVNAGQSTSNTTHFFAGPKQVRMLDSYEKELDLPHFDLVVDFGMFYFLTKPFYYVLTWISHTVGSFAIGLLMFTVLLRLMVFPLAQKSFRSFAKMRVIAPKMKELQETYKDNREGMQKALFELYRKEDVNPAAGCLPMLIQIPIFFALYKVLYVTIEMRHTPFFGWINDMSAPDPTTIFNLFGMIPWDVPSFLMIGAWPCIMCITLLIQQRLSPPPTDPFQSQIMLMMPFMMTFILSSFPAGLVIYWTWSNTLSVIQQSVLMKSMGQDIHLFSFFKKSKEDKILEEVEHPGALDMIEHEIEENLDDNAPITPITPPKRKRKKK